MQDWRTRLSGKAGRGFLCYCRGQKVPRGEALPLPSWVRLDLGVNELGRTGEMYFSSA